MIFGGDTFSDVVSVKTLNTNVKIENAPTIKVVKGSENSLVISWDKLSATKGYIVLRSEKKTRNYKELDTVETNEYTDTKLTYGKTYYYKVKACNSDNNCSGYSSVVSKKVIPGKPKFTTKVEEKEISLEVTKMEGSTGYKVYQSKSKNSGYKKVTTLTDELIYTNTLNKGTYYYKVRTYVTVNGKKVYGKYTSVQTVKVK